MKGDRATAGLVTIGIVLRAHGLRGFVRVKPVTDWPSRFAKLSRVCLLKDGEVHGRLEIEQMSLAGRAVLLKFRDVADRTAADALQGMALAIEREECMPLEANEYYAFEIIGMRVLDTSGHEIGSVADVIPNPANDVWIIRNGDKEWLIPATQEFVKYVDRDTGRITVDRLDEFED